MLSLKRTKKRPDSEDAAARESAAPSAGIDPKKLVSRIKPVGSKAKFVLMIGDEGAILVFVQNGKVVRRLFAPSAEKEHIKPIMELLEANPQTSLCLLCDAIDQSYVRHTLPPVSPLSINKLVRRRLERDFAPEDIKGALPLGREKGGRKEWNFMLISLANSDVLQQWLDPILEAPNQFTGIHLVPVEAQEFVLKLSREIIGSSGTPSQWQLLVSHDKVGGFRQVVLQDGMLVFTRLTQYSQDLNLEVTAGNIEQEVLNTIEYLRRLSYSEQAGLDITMILNNDLRELIDGAKLGGSRVTILSPFEVSQLLKLPQAALSGDRFADVVLSASLALRQKPKLRLFTAYGKKLDMMYKGRIALRLGGALIAALFLISAVSSLISWQGTRSDIADTETQLANAQQQMDAARARFDALGKDQNKVMRVAALYRATGKAPEGPIEFVRNFGALKDDSVNLVSWTWTAAYPPSPASAAGSTQPNRPPVPAASAAAQGKVQTSYVVSAQVEFLNNGNDVRVLSEEVDRFTQLLVQTFPNYEISHSPLPGVEEREQQRVIDFNNPITDEDFRLSEGQEVITYTISGPIVDPAQEAG